MDDLLKSLAVFSGILARLGIPLALTAIAVFLLKRLDLRWQDDADRQWVTSSAQVPQVRCWEKKGCSEERRAQCKAFKNKDIPCWQHFRADRGELKQDCLDCLVFHQAPIPVIG